MILRFQGAAPQPPNASVRQAALGRGCASPSSDHAIVFWTRRQTELIAPAACLPSQAAPGGNLEAMFATMGAPLL